MNYRELPTISEKQKEIMDLVYKFRFVNREQLQRLFGHKDASRLNKWLKDLVDKKYLGRIYSHKLLENTKPAIYYLNNNGIILVRYKDDGEQLDIKYLKKFYEDKHASLTFVNHCVTLFEFYIQLKKTEEDINKDFIEKRKKLKDYDKDLDKKLDYHIETKTEMWIEKQLHLYPDEDFSEIKQYIPDLYFERFTNLTEENMDSSTYFLELFDPKVPRYAIKYRIKQYIKLKEEGKWKIEYTGMDGKFPIILLIFPHQQKLNGLSKYIKEQLERSYESDGLIFLLTTYQKAMTETLVGNPRIWMKIMEE